MARTIKSKQEARRCGECVHGKTYINERCKSLDGEYFCLACKYMTRVVVRTEVACDNFKSKYDKPKKHSNRGSAQAAY